MFCAKVLWDAGGRLEAMQKPLFWWQMGTAQSMKHLLSHPRARVTAPRNPKWFPKGCSAPRGQILSARHHVFTCAVCPAGPWRVEGRRGAWGVESWGALRSGMSTGLKQPSQSHVCVYWGFGCHTVHVCVPLHMCTCVETAWSLSVSFPLRTFHRAKPCGDAVWN